MLRTTAAVTEERGAPFTIQDVGGIWQGMSGSPVYAADGRPAMHLVVTTALTA